MFRSSTTSDSFAPSFERVYRGNYEFVWRTLRALGVNDSAVDDAAQDVFVVVHRRLSEFEGRASIKTWLYEIVRRAAMRYRRKAVHDASRTFELPDLKAADDLDEAVDQAMAAEMLRAFVETLDEDRQRAFILAEFWEMRGREIASELDVNMNTVYARLRSARTELDRMAQRLQARNAGALTRALRASQPSRQRRERTWAGVIASIGLPTTAAAGTATVPLAAGAFKWIAVGGLAGTVAVSSAVALSTPTAPEDHPPKVAVETPSASKAASPKPPAAQPRPNIVAASVAENRPTIAAPRPRPVTQPSSPDTKDANPALSAELVRVRSIRASSRAGETAEVHRQIAEYRQQFPAGALRLEVDALEVEVACRTLEPSARQKLDALRRRQPGASLIDRLEKLCSAKNGPQKPKGRRTQSP